MADEFGSDIASFDEIERAYDRIAVRQLELEKNAERFSTSMANAFARSVTSGRTFEDTLRNLALKLSDLALTAAFKPLTSSLMSGLSGMFGNLFSGVGLQAATGAVKPFASGGVIGTPTYFPLSAGGLGLAGEAGPEAILPLARGPDGRLGVSANGGGGAASVVVHIATPDPGSFRRSEAYLTGQIARAVARGQRSL